MTLPSTHHSPTTVNRNASVFTIGTVRLNSAIHEFPWSIKAAPPYKAVTNHPPITLQPTP